MKAQLSAGAVKRVASDTNVMSAFSKYGFGTQRAIGGISTTKCATNLLDHVQAVRNAYEAANMHSPDSFVGRWRITPVPLRRRG
jgi:hypothetical protein